MQGSIQLESQLVSRSHEPRHPFSQTFPPPFRVILLLSFGVFCWALNIHGLRAWDLKPDDVLSADPAAGDFSALPLHSRKRRDDDEACEGEGSTLSTESVRSSSHVHPPSVGRARVHWLSHAPADLYALAAALATWALANWFLYKAYVGNQGDPSGRHAQALQGVAFIGLLIAAVWPGNVIFKKRRLQFGKALLSMCNPKALLLRAPTFPAILLADILTSFAKVFGDVWLTACFLYPRKEHHTWWNGRGSWAVPLFISLPYAIRLLQCLAEFRKGTTGIPTASRGQSSTTIQKKPLRPLANALKYASAFPVIWISASQIARPGPITQQNSSGTLWQFWLLSVFVNSLFSFWWDVTNDWGLQVFQLTTWKSGRNESTAGGKSLHRRGLSTWPAPAGESHSAQYDNIDYHGSGDTTSARHARSLSTMFLRPPSSGGMLFSPTVYQLAILADLLLRFTWSLKLSPHLAQLVELESGVFVLETLEILRRCGWVFLRVEWEIVKRRRASELTRTGYLPQISEAEEASS